MDRGQSKSRQWMPQNPFRNQQSIKQKQWINACSLFSECIHVVCFPIFSLVFRWILPEALIIFAWKWLEAHHWLLGLKWNPGKGKWRERPQGRMSNSRIASDWQNRNGFPISWKTLQIFVGTSIFKQHCEMSLLDPVVLKDPCWEGHSLEVYKVNVAAVYTVGAHIGGTRAFLLQSNVYIGFSGCLWFLETCWTKVKDRSSQMILVDWICGSCIERLLFLEMFVLGHGNNPKSLP